MIGTSNTQLDEIVDDVCKELGRAVSKFPTWPTDSAHAFGVLAEEFGEVADALFNASAAVAARACGDLAAAKADLRAEAIQTAAMAVRFAASIDAYDYGPLFWSGAGTEDALRILARVAGSYGVLAKAVLQATYEPEKVAREDITRAAAALASSIGMFMAGLDSYIYAPCEQHLHHSAEGPASRSDCA